MLDGNERIQEIDTVDKTQREGTTIYDIIFQAKVPVTGAMIGLIINVEIQNDEKLLYYVVTRGLYYCARMLSAQKNRIFMHSDYQKIQKVYSIWICPYAKNGKNTIASYDMKEHVHFGDVDVPKEAYDKLETVVITMNADGIKSESELIRYLSLLLNREMPQEERVEALKNEYHIQVDDALREDVSKMCNYSDAILRMGENKGLEQGRIMEAVSIYRDEMEMDDNSIIKKIMKRFTLQEQDARKYVIPQSNAKISYKPICCPPCKRPSLDSFHSWMPAGWAFFVFQPVFWLSVQGRVRTTTYQAVVTTDGTAGTAKISHGTLLLLRKIQKK